MTVELGSLLLASEADVFAGRRLARETAAALGLDGNNQVRVATAVSEIGRVIVTSGATAQITMGIATGVESVLVIVVVPDDRFDADSTAAVAGLEAGRRLMDSLTIEAPGDQGRGAVISLTKVLPAGVWVGAVPELKALRARLARSTTSSPLEELRSQNAELMATLEELRTNQDELVRFNVELEETNRGVMAMYAQLSAELEETNRGVVALYAELDERGAQLRLANETKSRFLASVSHELRGPLASIRGLARLLQEPDSEAITPMQAHQVGLIASSAEELLGLVNGLLDLARAESGKLEPRPALVNLDELLSDLCATLRPLAYGGVELTVDIRSEADEIETDRMLLTQLVRNLVTNALKFTEEGFVRVHASSLPSSNMLAIAVEDTGIGIATEHQQLVFEEFFQVPGPLQARSKNSGLGLPYARRVAEALGGHLAVVSQVGVGSTFTATLPTRWVAPARSTAGERTRDASGPAAVLRTVLIVDDEAPFREYLRQLLQGTVERVVEADDGPGALETMRRLRPDLVLLDWRMPDGGGEWVISEASKDETLRAIPITVVTSVGLSDPALQRLGPSYPILSKSDLTKASLLVALESAGPRGPQP